MPWNKSVISPVAWINEAWRATCIVFKASSISMYYLTSPYYIERHAIPSEQWLLESPLRTDLKLCLRTSDYLSSIYAQLNKHQETPKAHVRLFAQFPSSSFKISSERGIKNGASDFEWIHYSREIMWLIILLPLFKPVWSAYTYSCFSSISKNNYFQCSHCPATITNCSIWTGIREYCCICAFCSQTCVCWRCYRNVLYVKEFYIAVSIATMCVAVAQEVEWSDQLLNSRFDLVSLN